MLTPEIQKDSLMRLKRIEGQIKGIQRMVEERKYCVDILLQISAICGALRKVGHIILKNHIETCVTEAMTSSWSIRGDISFKFPVRLLCDIAVSGRGYLDFSSFPARVLAVFKLDVL